MKKLLILMLLLAPSLASASNHLYTCADMLFREGASSCTSGIVSFSTDTDYMDSDSVGTPNSNPVYPLTLSATYFVYVSATTGSSGTLTLGSYRLGGGGFGLENKTFNPVSSLSGSFVNARPTGSSFDIGNFSGNTNTFTGTVGPICISNVSAADAQSLCSPVVIAPPPFDDFIVTGDL